MSEAKFVDTATIIVKTVYEQMFGPMPDQEFQKLKESIRKVGQLYPITVNQRHEVIDGHKRLKACRELCTDVLVEVRHFQDEAEERRWMHIANLNRSQLTDFGRIEVVFNDEPFVREEARRRQLSGLRRGSSPPLSQNQADGEEKGRSDQRCADWAGVSRDMYIATRNLLRENKISEEVKADLRSGRADLKRVLRSLSKRSAENTSLARTFKGEFYVLSDNIGLVYGAFTEINETHSNNRKFDLIFPTADCSYDRKLLKHLAIFASRFLSIGGFFILYTKHAAIGNVANTVKKYAMDLDLMYAFQEHFDGWLCVDEKNQFVTCCDAMFLIFWKKDKTRLSSKRIQEYEFCGACSTDADPASHNPDALITPREANLHVIDYLLDELDLEEKNGFVCDPICQFGEVGLKVVERGLAFLGIEENHAKFQVAKATFEKYAKDCRLSQEEDQQTVMDDADDEEGSGKEQNDKAARKPEAQNGS